MSGSDGHGNGFSSFMKVILLKRSSKWTLLHKTGTVQIIFSRNNSSGKQLLRQ